MEVVIPHVEDDQIIYAAVEGKDIEGVLRRRNLQDDSSTNGGNQKLRAIRQPAAPLAQAAQLL
jgi:hypothetical protein